MQSDCSRGNPLSHQLNILIFLGRGDRHQFGSGRGLRSAKIRPGAEISTRPVENDRANLWVLISPLKSQPKRFPHWHRHSIFALGSVEQHPEHTVHTGRFEISQSIILFADRAFGEDLAAVPTGS